MWSHRDGCFDWRANYRPWLTELPMLKKMRFVNPNLAWSID
jgi:hypothetical protein